MRCRPCSSAWSPSSGSTRSRRRNTASAWPRSATRCRPSNPAPKRARSMPDFLGVAAATPDPLAVIVIRLIVATVFGAAVAFVYRRTRRMPASSFTITLVLLAILIAMVTQVIGNNVARAFSLVGALSIVRFRTVVRDTQDTAYVIFAVAVGMAMGANHPLVAVIGIV